MEILGGVLLVVLLGMVATRVLWRSTAAPETGSAAFVPVVDTATLDEWFTRSSAQAVTLFLHDPGCPISAAAYHQMLQLDGDVAMVDVHAAKQLSRAVETRTGFRHESPQVIVLWHGQAVWSASHFDITATAVEHARRAAAPADPAPQPAGEIGRGGR